MIVEVGIKLDKPLSHYQQILIRAGAINVYNCETHDLYWSNKLFDGMTENEIKMACVRYRMCRGLETEDWVCVFQNYKLVDKNNDYFRCDRDQLSEHEEIFKCIGMNKVFDTHKFDYQYAIGDMKSRIQLQDIDNVGLLLYYDNPDYYHIHVDEQRKALIDELNSYGFDFTYDLPGLDKLRTLWYKKECFSFNQNG